mgnify:CR=1 FL=1|jgi:ADP-ribose pyrophosphatase
MSLHTMMNKNDYAVLSNPIRIGAITSNFALGADFDEQMVSNISIVPTVGDKYVVMQLENGLWELIGGTLEPGEAYMHALQRELMEEIGAEMKEVRIIGRFHCLSDADKPYRPHIPHPRFIRLLATGEVRIVSRPLNPEDGEQVAKVELVEIEEAIRRFEAIERYDIAEMYKLAHQLREQA